MPNWVKNVVTVSEDTMNKIKEKYFVNGELDFNKIIPMPNTLELEEGSITEKAIYYSILQKDDRKRKEIIELLSNTKDILEENYWSKIEKYISNGNFNNIEEYAKEYVPDNTAKNLNINSFEELGNMYIENIRQYGHTTWYNWCIENWGTKWNVSNFICNKTTMIFETAWSTPEPIFEKLSKEFPNDYIELKYADECYSNNNNGQLIFKNGTVDMNIDLDEKFAENVWDITIDDEKEDIDYEMFD